VSLTAVREHHGVFGATEDLQLESVRPLRSARFRWRRCWLATVWRRLRGLVIDQVTDTLSIVILMLPLSLGSLFDLLRLGDDFVRKFLGSLHELAQAVLVTIYVVQSALNFIRHSGGRGRK
jgi:hypothetical protein